jgi:hypothetical protein
MDSIKARFFGRKTLIIDLVQGLLAPSQPLDYSLVGPKMVGKSRFLKYLASEEGPLKGPDPDGLRPERFRDGDNIIIGHFDCDWPEAKAHLTQFVSQRLRNQLEDEKQLRFELDWSRIDQASSAGQQIGQMVHQLEQQRMRLLLLLDNFDHVLKSPAVIPDVINELRPLTNELGLVVATEEALHDLNQILASSPLFNVMHQHFVGLLEPRAAREWIEAYRERYNFTAEIAVELQALAGGHPFLLARINDVLTEVETLLPGQNLITEAQLPLIQLRLGEHGRPLFEMNWKKLIHRPSSIPLVQQLIQSPIGIGELPTDHAGTLNWLINQAMAKYDRVSYRLFSPLFVKFLRDKEQISVEPEPKPSNFDEFLQTLAPKEGDLLRYLRVHSHMVVSIDQLLAEVWQQPEASPRRVQEAIRRLRHTLSRQDPPLGVIENQRGEGYRFIPSI